MDQKKATETSVKELPGTVFCQYASGPCPESFPDIDEEAVLFLYPLEPTLLSSPIEDAVNQLRKKYHKRNYCTWRDIKKEGKTVFCEICKAIATNCYSVCDITTLNFNVLFEIGYIFGLSKPLRPILSKAAPAKKAWLRKIGLLDTIGYTEFLNTDELMKIIEAGANEVTLQRSSNIDTFQPIYYLKSPLATEASVRITARLKKSALKFRTYDPAESIRLSVHTAVKQVDKSRAVVMHLLSEKLVGEIAQIHNARCAFVAGLAMASQKRVLMVQEGTREHPIDYRDIVMVYEHLWQIDTIMQAFFEDLIQTLQSSSKQIESTQRSILEDVDVGDIAAENEIESLRSYYVRTGQYTEARNGHAQLIVGRKGSGKTALFYALRHYIRPNRTEVLVLDLKPEGYQFAKLQETVLKDLSPAVKEHTITAFWDYLLLLEIAHKILRDKNEFMEAYKHPEKAKRLEAIKCEYEQHRDLEQGDFSERLTALVNGIIRRAPEVALVGETPEITNLVYSSDVAKLRDLLVEYLTDKEEVWLLFDNLDKNWTGKITKSSESTILRCLLDACRKLQRMFQRKRINFNSVVFIRNDIYRYFLENTSDRGKDRAVYLDWDDPEIFKELFRLRVTTSGPTYTGEPDEVWGKIFDLHVAGESSYNYILARTMMRPRDFLQFVHAALQTAINRGHPRVTREDILKAEQAYSRDLFENLMYEIRDIKPELEEILYCFLERDEILYEGQLRKLLQHDGKIKEEDIDEVVQVLLWFCFLGVWDSDMNERYAYSVGYDIKKLLGLSDWALTENSERVFSIHPGFRMVLELKHKPQR